ncbi:hypothetical protein Q7P35_012093 [Cladosporium inversicolor]
MATMCRRFLEALLALSGTSNCFPRPGRSLANGTSPEDNLQKSTASASGDSTATTQPEHDYSTANHQVATNPSQTSLPNDRNPNLHARTRQASSEHSSSSSSSSMKSSLRSASSALHASLNRRISWQTNRSDEWTIDNAEGEPTGPEDVAVTTSESNNEDFIASLDALALSQHERELLSRMQFICQSARAARERRVGRQDWSGGDGISGDGIGGVEPGLRLRGGAFSSPVRPSRTLRRRTSLPVDDPVPPRPNSARPPRGLWWLAGGGKGKVPTLGELRVRKEVERANRRIVGFWGTVLGIRRVRRVGILDDGDKEGDDRGSSGAERDVDEGSSHGSKSVDSMAGRPAAGGGGSLMSSRRERETGLDQAVEAKAESVASVDDGPGSEKEDVADDTARDHASTTIGDMADAGVEETKARLERAKSVTEDHESTKAGGVTDAGVEEPKARPESTKGVAEDTGTAEAESVRSRDGIAEIVDEDKAKSSSDD